MWNTHSAHSHGSSLKTLLIPMMEDDFEELFGRPHLRQLWFLFLAINTRANPTRPAVMRKRELVQLMRLARLVEPAGGPGSSGSGHGVGGNASLASAGPKAQTSPFTRHPLAAALLEADVHVIHTSEASRGTTKQFTWTPFLRALVATSRKVYGRLAPGGEPHALKLLLDVNLLPHTTHLVASFVGNRARGFLPSVDGLLPPLLADSEQRRRPRSQALSSASSASSWAGDDEAEGPHAEGSALVALLARFGPCLKDLFSYFAQVLPRTAPWRPEGGWQYQPILDFSYPRVKTRSLCTVVAEFALILPPF